MKRIRQCLIAAAAFALIFGTAYADSTINAVVDDAASAIKVRGEFDNSAKDYVNIQILSGRYDAASFDELSEEEIYGKVKYFRQKIPAIYSIKVMPTEKAAGTRSLCRNSEQSRPSSRYSFTDKRIPKMSSAHTTALSAMTETTQMK